jgi:hypothetical protein
MRTIHFPSRPVIFAIILWLTGGSAGFAPATAPETIRQYLSGTDGQHTVPGDFICYDGRNCCVWTNIVVPSCWELQGFWKFRCGLEDKPYTAFHADYRHRFNVPANSAQITSG